MIDIIETDGLQAGLNHLSTDLTNSKLRAVIKDLYSEVGLRHAFAAERRLRKDIRKRFGNSEAWIRIITEYLERFLWEKVVIRVHANAKKKLEEILLEAIKEGWSVSEVVNRLSDIHLYRYQSARIVRTEVNRAANVGVHAQGETFEYELVKGWDAVNDSRTRGVNPDDHADHIRMDGQTVDFYGMFTDPRSGVQLRFPGDPEADPGDTINCRCQMTTDAKRDERGRLIPKKSRISVLRPGEIRRPRTVTI